MKVFFKGRVLKLVQRQCVLPHGRTTTLEVIEHPGAVLIIPFIQKDTVILLRQFRPTIKRYLYELPAELARRRGP